MRRFYVVVLLMGVFGCTRHHGRGCGKERRAAADAARAAADTAMACTDPATVPRPSGTRRAVGEAILRTGQLDVYLDPRRPDVVVPPQFRNDVRLILRIGYDMP